jgi:2,5-diketo-D-gluconate reductase B
MDKPNGIPLLGLGTYPLRGDDVVRSVHMAIECGVSHIDTAQMYGNEADVGRAIRSCGVARDQLFVVTKVDPSNLTKARFAGSVRQSMDDLGGPADLLLIHWPPADAELDAMLDQLLDAKSQGHAKDIGVSNFSPSRMQRAQARLKGQVICNQVEFHPLLNQSNTLAVAKELGIALAAYSPIARGAALKHDLVIQLAAKYGEPASAIVLRWIIQQRVIAIPMTTKRENMLANMRALSFTLEDADMAALTRLGTDSGRTVAPSWMADRWD